VAAQLPSSLFISETALPSRGDTIRHTLRSLACRGHSPPSTSPQTVDIDKDSDQSLFIHIIYSCTREIHTRLAKGHSMGSKLKDLAESWHFYIHKNPAPKGACLTSGNVWM